MTTPDWVKDAVIYQIFPDRFANGNNSANPPGIQRWGSTPNLWGFQGGNLPGIIQHFDYLLDLGITAIYLTPIFQASSNHRYNVSDYYKIDPKLGTMADFQALVETAHRNNIRVILDGVFNHCGRGFFAFVDVLENGKASPYKDWFHIKKFPLDAYGGGAPKNYLGWNDHKSLPKFNTDNSQVRKYLFDIARFWIEQGADGWRLDVPDEIDDDGFWEEFRRVVKSANRDAYLLGEIWNVNPRWANERHFDGLMNYPMREALLSLLQGRRNAVHLSGCIEGILKAYALENLFSMYVPLGSHDTERIRTLLGNDPAKILLAFLFQMGFIGAPAVYYGDEIGLKGGKDPDSRRAFPWMESDWDHELRQWVKLLISLRKQTPSLRRGEFIPLLTEEYLYAFARILGEETVVVAINASDQARQTKIPCQAINWLEGRTVRSLIDGKKFVISGINLSLDIPPWSGMWVG